MGNFGDLIVFLDCLGWVADLVFLGFVGLRGDLGGLAGEMWYELLLVEVWLG